jgi:hypothetical protein
MTFRDPRFVIAYTIIALFAGAYVFNPSDTMNGALIAAFAGAWGWYLGSSSGAAKGAENTAKALDIVASGPNGAAKPDVTLAPGETAQAAPTPSE